MLFLLLIFHYICTFPSDTVRPGVQLVLPAGEPAGLPRPRPAGLRGLPRDPAQPRHQREGVRLPRPPLRLVGRLLLTQLRQTQEVPAGPVPGQSSQVTHSRILQKLSTIVFIEWFKVYRTASTIN